MGPTVAQLEQLSSQREKYRPSLVRGKCSFRNGEENV